jgi:hypothetical protein
MAGGSLLRGHQFGRRRVLPEPAQPQIIGVSKAKKQATQKRSQAGTSWRRGLPLAKRPTQASASSGKWTARRSRGQRSAQWKARAPRPKREATVTSTRSLPTRWTGLPTALMTRPVSPFLGQIFNPLGLCLTGLAPQGHRVASTTRVLSMLKNILRTHSGSAHQEVFSVRKPPDSSRREVKEPRRLALPSGPAHPVGAHWSARRSPPGVPLTCTRIRGPCC